MSYHNVEDAPADHTDEFALRLGDLVVHAAQYTACRNANGCPGRSATLVPVASSKRRWFSFP